MFTTMILFLIFLLPEVCRCAGIHVYDCNKKVSLQLYQLPGDSYLSECLSETNDQQCASTCRNPKYFEVDNLCGNQYVKFYTKGLLEKYTGFTCTCVGADSTETKHNGDQLGCDMETTNLTTLSEHCTLVFGFCGCYVHVCWLYVTIKQKQMY
eukprot:UN25749